MTALGQIGRLERLKEQHAQRFPGAARSVALSAPGRVEIIGNHTDHNHGLVLAAAVNLDTMAAVSPRKDLRVHLHSDGYPVMELTLDSLDTVPGEAGTSLALIRGVAAGLNAAGYAYGGFDAVMNSQVLSGSGLSSSAAFEVLVCYIFDVLYNGTVIDAVTRAKIGQYAENVYFLKPSGLMDQMASSCGGMVRIDFGGEQPQVENLQFSFAKAGYAMVVVSTDSSHDDLTPAYAAIPAEMKAAATAAGGKVLRDICFDQFLKALPAVRRTVGDRAVLRAIHYYQENQRVLQAAAALKDGRLDDFFKAVNDSGLSSWTQLQNISVSDHDQPIALALAAARQVLSGRGACRIHGGGFAGTTLNFVPKCSLACFIETMEMLFGAGCCHILDVRSQGPLCLE
ncbi:MAG: galactokinase [Christensenellales bacterium]|jgi:galactokinase